MRMALRSSTRSTAPAWLPARHFARAANMGPPIFCAPRTWWDRCPLAIVAKIVEIDSILARRLRHLRNVKLGILPLKLERETMRELLDCRPLVIRPNGK